MPWRENVKIVGSMNCWLTWFALIASVSDDSQLAFTLSSICIATRREDPKRITFTICTSIHCQIIVSVKEWQWWTMRQCWLDEKPGDQLFQVIRTFLLTQQRTGHSSVHPRQTCMDTDHRQHTGCSGSKWHYKCMGHSPHLKSGNDGTSHKVLAVVITTSNMTCYNSRILSFQRPAWIILITEFWNMSGKMYPLWTCANNAQEQEYLNAFISFTLLH